MEKFNELLTKLKELKIIQTEGELVNHIPDYIWNKYFKGNYRVLQSGLDIEKLKWHETSTTVIKIFGGLLGVRYITDIYSESLDYSDFYRPIEFMEMREIQVTSYEKTTAHTTSEKEISIDQVNVQDVLLRIADISVNNLTTSNDDRLLLRDKFAIYAMNGELSAQNFETGEHWGNETDLAKRAYLVADAMIRERKNQ